jgi:surface polysaccharide O-acyltransferase-like enzyme
VILDQFGDLLTDKLSYHLYFVSLILGLYALTPFLGKMVRALTQKELGLLVAIGVGVYSLKTFIPGLLVVDHFQLSAYIFYYLLGYYLYKYPPGKTFRTLIYIAGIVSAVLMTWLNYRVEYVHKGHGDSYYASDGAFVYAITVAVFIFFQRLFRGPGTGGGPVRRGALFISSNSYGIYIAHPLVISFLLYGDLGSFSFSTAQCKFILAGYRVTILMNNAWGVVVQAMLVMVALLVFFYLVSKLRLQRYFT